MERGRVRAPGARGKTVTAPFDRAEAEQGVTWLRDVWVPLSVPSRHAIADQLAAALAEIDRYTVLRDAAVDMVPDWNDTSGSTSRVYAMNEHCARIADAALALADQGDAAARDERASLRAEIARLHVENADLLADRLPAHFAARRSLADHESRAARLRAQFETDDPDLISDLISETMQGVLRESDAMQGERDELRSDVARMRPVVEAAERWRGLDVEPREGLDAIVAAVDEYHRSQK